VLYAWSAWLLPRGELLVGRVGVLLTPVRPLEPVPAGKTMDAKAESSTTSAAISAAALGTTASLTGYGQPLVLAGLLTGLHVQCAAALVR
jgi:hypothetical protein